VGKVCKNCDEIFFVKDHRKSDARFCSRKCYGSDLRKNPRRINVGRKISEETRKKMSESGKQKIFTEEHRKNISNAIKGKTKSEEHRKKLSEANIGKKVPDDIRKKISESNKGKKHTAEELKKMSESLMGHVLSEETKKKISEYNIKQLIVNPELSYYVRQQEYYTDEYIHWRMFCLKRDKYKCVLCSNRKDLHVHHIIPRAINPELEFDVNNGITLCLEHHICQHPGLEHFMNSKKSKKEKQNMEILNEDTICN
jgi:ribosomal protein L24E